MRYSSIGKRILAFLIDAAAVDVTCLVLIEAGFEWVAASSAIVFVIYNMLMMGSPWHATLGQKALRICVVDARGYGIDYPKAIARAFSFFISVLTLGVGHMLALFSDKRQTLHDRIAGTYVVDCERAIILGPPKDVHPGPVRITAISGEKAGTSYPIDGNGLMIGRDPTVCRIILNNSQGISRIHCFVSYNSSSGMYIVSDRNSTYGTFTQYGRRIHPQSSVALKSGERFYLGTSRNMFEVG